MMTQSDAVRRNIQDIVELQERTQRRRTFSDRLADAIASFTGTIVFVVLHLAWFGLWAAANVGLFGGARFDPYPFQLLCMLVSLEGVLLSAFVLIKQNRMAKAADRRAHLDLQVNLLSEKEISTALAMLQRLSEHVGVQVDDEVRELAQHTAVADLAHELEQKLPEET